MKYLLTVLILLWLPCISTADSGPIFVMPGGNVIPVSNNDIQLQSEQIDIYLTESFYYTVKVTYDFVNHGNDQKVTMGFPNIKRGEGDNAFELVGFEALVNGKDKKITRRSLDKTGKSYAIAYTKYYDLPSDMTREDHGYFDEVYECFSTSFKKGERKKIVNTYTATGLNQTDKISYILKTGALWKDNIEDVKVNVHFSREHGWDLDLFKSLFEYSNCVLSSRYALDIYPSDYRFVENRIEMHFTDLEPDFDIHIQLPRIPRSLDEWASSELDGYPATNAVDKDPATAWVEGAPSSGVGEWLTFNNDQSVLVKKIAIYAGYGKSRKTYYENNRVKQVRIKTEGVGRQLGKSYLLKDTMGLQYLEFDYPVCLSGVTVTIEDVYKGSKYDDTPISEIKLVPAKAGEFAWASTVSKGENEEYLPDYAVDGNSRTAWVEDNSRIAMDLIIRYDDDINDSIYISSTFSLSKSNSPDHQLPAIIDSIGIIYGTTALESDSLKPRKVSIPLINEYHYTLAATDSMQYIKLSEPQFVENINLLFHRGSQNAAIKEIKSFKSDLTVIGENTVPSKGNRYAPMNVVDGDPNTAWASSVFKCGVDSDFDCGRIGDILSDNFLLVTVSNAKDHQLPARISKIGIIGGYAKNKKVYLNNERVKDVRLILYPSGEEYQYTLKDTMTMQYLDIPIPQMVSAYELWILSTYDGRGDDSDITISEVKTFLEK